MFLFSEKPDPIFLMLDVQSSMVRGSIVQNRKSGPPVVIYSHSIFLGYKPHAESSYLIKVTLKAVRDVIEETMRYISIHHKNGSIPKEFSTINYILSSPWIVSEAKMIGMSFTKDMTITKKYILDLIHSSRPKISADENSELTSVEEKIFDVRLNGYSVSDWEEKEAKQLEISFAVSIAGKRMIELFIKACNHVVPDKKIYFHSSLLLQYIGIQSVMPNRADYLLVHVHGELTDLALIRRKTCTFFGSYPVGIRTLIRKIGITSKLDNQAADSLLTLYTAKQLDSEHNKDSLIVINNVSKGWSTDLSRLLDKSASTFPGSVLLSAWGHDEFFSACLGETFPGARIALLSIDDLKGLIEFGPHTEHVRLVGIYAIAIHNMFHH